MSTVFEIESLAALRAHLDAGRSLDGVVLQGLDLRPVSARLLSLPLSGAVFLGCELDAALLQAIFTQGALHFPALPALPYSPYRGALYTPEELYAGFSPEQPESYHQTLDFRVYQHWRKRGHASPGSIVEALAQRLHDHAISDGIEDLLQRSKEPRRVVAIMGGHSMRRGSSEYRAVTDIARALSQRGFLMVSGGGPGAMEATHLGAYFADRSEAELAEALDMLARAPVYKDTHWLSAAFRVREKYPPLPTARVSLGVPTWHYGHEPPNPFPSHIAKYFANSVREDGILTIATGGVVFAPGSAGTIQEVFQDACQNHYNTVGVVSPMVFLGEGFWKWNRPVFPLLAQLAAGHEYARHLSITDSVEQVVHTLEAFATAHLK